MTRFWKLQLARYVGGLELLPSNINAKIVIALKDQDFGANETDWSPAAHTRCIEVDSDSADATTQFLFREEPFHSSRYAGELLLLEEGELLSAENIARRCSEVLPRIQSDISRSDFIVRIVLA